MVSVRAIDVNNDVPATVMDNIIYNVDPQRVEGGNINTPGTIHTVDYNAYDSDGYYHDGLYDDGTYYASLSEWQSAMGYDLHSYEAQGSYCSFVDTPTGATDYDYDLHVTGNCLTMSSTGGEVGAYGITDCVGHTCGTGGEIGPYCGDGTCNGAETCTSCSADCGSCPAVCGNGECEAGETQQNCAEDCGTPIQTCSQQGGDICLVSETCPGSLLTASDSDRCCSITCQASSGDEIIVDNQDAGFSTTDGSDPRGWWSSGYANPYAGSSIGSDINLGSTATWSASLDGTFDVFAWWTSGELRPNDAEYTINHASGSSTINVNQLQNGGQWNLLGTYPFSGTGSVVLSDTSSDPAAGAVCADAVRFVSTVGCVPTHAADNNPCDNSVSMNELISYINSWITGAVTLQDVMGAIVIWKG